MRKVFPNDYGRILRSFGLEKLTNIMPPCNKACYEAYIGDYVHHFRLTNSRIQRIIKFQLQKIDFITNHADLIDKYKY